MSAMLRPDQLKAWLHDGREIALLDVREQGQFGEGHLFYAIPLPYSRLELDVVRLVPRRTTRIVVHDGGGDEDTAERAAARLAAIGYRDVYRLAGGTAAWAGAGLRLFKGVNLPSKTFGELVEQTVHTPRISAADLARRQAAGERLVVLDGRPLDEYRKMNIPGARCCPNGELALRVEGLVPDPRTPIVINCAGRTRSIIGAQTLIDLGIPNPVLALENGTQGWYLTGLELEHGNERRYPDEISPALRSRARERARALAARHRVPALTAGEAQAWIDDRERSCFVLDVRTGAEFQAGTLPGAAHAPGGQLLQATDQYVGVRHARLLLVDDDDIRAPVVASWLRRMGWEAATVVGGIASGLRAAAAEPVALPVLPSIEARALAGALDQDRVLAIELRPGMAYRKAHIPKSVWSIRPRVVEMVRAARAGTRGPVVLIADSPALARMAALDLEAAGVTDLRQLDGGIAAWTAAGLPTEASADRPADADCIDYLFFVHDRHDGNKDAARAYLAWETGLLAQLDEAERSGFRIG